MVAIEFNARAVVAEDGVNHRGQVNHRPAVAMLAVGRQLVLVTVRAGEGVEVDHGVSLLSPLAHRTSLRHLLGCVSSASKIVIWQTVLLPYSVSY